MSIGDSCLAVQVYVACGAGRNDGVRPKGVHAADLAVLRLECGGRATGSDRLNHPSFCIPSQGALSAAKPETGVGRLAIPRVGVTRRVGCPKLSLGHYVGDYDSPSWLYKAVPVSSGSSRGRNAFVLLSTRTWRFFGSPKRGLCVPSCIKNDFFHRGDSGAGYITPSRSTVRPFRVFLRPGELGKRIAPLFRAWDLKFTGLIWTVKPDARRRGICGFRGFHPTARAPSSSRARHPRRLSTCPNRDLLTPARRRRTSCGPAKAAAGKTGLLWARSMMSPAWYDEVLVALERHTRRAFEVVDPLHILRFIRIPFDEAPY